MGRKARIKRERREQREKVTPFVPPSGAGPRATTDAILGKAAMAGATVVATPADEEKISAVLLRFAEPILYAIDAYRRAPIGDVRMALTIAQIVWCAPLLGVDPVSKVEELLKSESKPGVNLDGWRTLVALLNERRLKEFAHDRRLITALQVNRAPDGQLMVAAAYQVR